MPDYIVVGAGSAGCVLAARLTRGPDVSVLLLEAGPPDTADNIHIPARFGSLSAPTVDWDYATAHEPQLRRPPHLPAARQVLGGSSSINAMVYIRGNRARLRRLGRDGATGWGYDDLLPYFKRAEDNERGADALPRRRRAADGVARSARATAMARRVRRGRRRGRASRATRTSTAPSRTASAATRSRSSDGRRCSAAVAYLHPAMERPNLTVETAPAGPPRRCSRHGRAVGVAGERRRRADRAARRARGDPRGGAFNSPQLLMLSGIGPAEHLDARRIDVVLDQPLGRPEPAGPRRTSAACG